MHDCVLFRARLFSTSRQAGFTLVEMVCVIIVLGILAVVSVPRLFNRQTYDARTFYDTTLSMLQYGQKIAIAQQRVVTVNVNAANNSICLTYNGAACGNVAQSIANPANNQPFAKTAPGGVSITPTTTFSFSSLGSTTTQVNLAVSGDGRVRTIVVERETGYVH